VNVRVYRDGKLRRWVTARHAKYPTTIGYHAEVVPKPGRRLSAHPGGAINCSGRITRYSDIGLEFLRRGCCWPEVVLGSWGPLRLCAVVPPLSALEAPIPLGEV
jgi:hypothetical protein